MVFNSLNAITGKNRTNNKNKVKNNPSEPMKIPTSTHEGEYMVHMEGKYSLCNEVTMITKRSNHIPMFTKMEMMNVARMLVRIRLNQNS
jgi:hypothetical protein